MSKASHTGSKQTGGWVLRNVDLVLMLPPPKREFTWYGLPDREDTPDPFPEDYLNVRGVLQTNNVIKKVGVDVSQRETGTTDRRSLWQVEPDVWEYAAKVQLQKREADKTLPCGHSSGFRTVDADEGVYECGFDYCSETFDRGTIEEVSF